MNTFSVETRQAHAKQDARILTSMMQRKVSSWAMQTARWVQCLVYHILMLDLNKILSIRGKARPRMQLLELTVQPS